MQDSNRVAALAIAISLCSVAFSQPINSSSTNENANANTTLKSIKTVDELLAVDNENALRKAQSRRFGEASIPGTSATSSTALQPSNAMMLPPAPPLAPVVKTAPRVEALAIYGVDTLSADLHVAGQTLEGARVGSSIAGCTVAEITHQRVKFTTVKGQLRCTDAVWSGESPSPVGQSSALSSPGSMVNGTLTFQVPPLPPLK